ncbi:MAG: FemAB, partial [Alphaproteobacteria bacterium]|nr:FemAB [Alphaproteobacteria bacterium]
MMLGNGADLAVILMDLNDPALARAVDAFVLAHADGLPFHRPAWLHAIEQATGNRALLLAAVGPSGRIRGILPLHHVRSRLFGAALVSTAFAVGGGILAEDDRAIAVLAAAAEGLAGERGGLSLELRGGPAPGDNWQRLDGAHVGFVRPLAVDDDAELLAIPRKHRA